jgi:hypothetical protein
MILALCQLAQVRNPLVYALKYGVMVSVSFYALKVVGYRWVRMSTARGYHMHLSGTLPLLAILHTICCAWVLSLFQCPLICFPAVGLGLK